MRGLSVLPILLLVTAGCLGPAQEVTEPGTEAVAGLLERQLTPEERSASEVSIASDPTDPEHLVAAANSAGGFDVYVTRDAGATWDVIHLTPEDLSGASATGFQSLSDPVVAFGPDGTPYLAALAYLPTSTVLVAESPDGGTSWPTVHTVTETDPALRFNDKEWLAVNPATGTLIVAWQREPAVDQLRSIEQATGLDVDVGDVVVARSTDGGSTWTEPMEIDRGMHNNGTQVAIGQDGTVHALWVNYETDTLDHARSTDDGASWSQPEAIAEVDTVPAYARYSRMHTLPAMVVSQDGQHVYAVWHDNRTGDADIFAVASGDGGATWGPATRVNQDEPRNGVLQLYPWAAVDSRGTLHVTFYSGRPAPAGGGLTYHHAMADGPELAFGPSQPVSTAPFEAFAAPGCSQPTGQPCSGIVSLGDYTGLAVSQAGLFPAWADGRGETSRIFAARLHPNIAAR